MDIMLDRLRMFALVAFATVLTTLSLPAQDEAQPRPLPAGPEALTSKRHQAEVARFWADVLLAECGGGKEMRADWKPHLDELTTAYAEVFCAGFPDGDRAERCLRLVDTLRELGCDDPAVQVMSGYALFYLRRHDEARQALATATARLDGGQASPLLRFRLHNTRCVFHEYHKEPELAREAVAARDECLVALAGSPAFEGGKERIFLEIVLVCWRNRVGADDLPVLERMEERAGKPTYALLVLRAMYHTTMAWAARGQGPASSVGEADRKAFAEHLEAAAERLTKAHQDWPQHPEAPTAMLKVLGPAGAEAQVLRQWFDRAVAAQFDWRDAYLSYLHYLQPRWGGSQRALRDLGRECLATARFDTEVPSFYRLAMHYVTLGSSDPASVWQSADVQRGLAELDEGSIAAATSDAAKVTATTHRIVALALGDKAPEAAALCTQLGGRFDPRALEIYGVTEHWLRKTLRPHLANYEPAVVAAGDLFAGSQDARFPGQARARPLAAHTAASTGTQADERYKAWLAATYVAAYDRAGRHDQAWDADARALLANFGSLVLGERSDETLRLAKQLQAAGCKDPLVQYAVARALGPDDAAGMARMLAAALPGLARSQPEVFSWWAKGHLSDLARDAGRPGVGSGLLPDMRAHLVAAIADPVFADDHRRHYLRCLWGNEEFAKAGNDWMTDRMIATLATVPGAHPWIVHVVTGLHHTRKARHHQGSANERAALLALASEHLGKAHELCPQFPEAAVGMIYVATMVPGAVSPREWFDRAVAAELDFEPAYRAFVESLRPRHGGSVQAMYRFAVECLESGRFDSDVPLWYARTLQRIQTEVRVGREVWASAGVADRLERMFAGYEAAGRWASWPGYLRSGRCMLAWAGGRYDEALAAWAAAGRQLDARWLPVVGQEDADLIEFDLRHLDKRRSGK